MARRRGSRTSRFYLLYDKVCGEYAEPLKRMADLEVKMPGYVSHEPFVAEGGERLTLNRVGVAIVPFPRLRGEGGAKRRMRGKGEGRAASPLTPALSPQAGRGGSSQLASEPGC
jgi:hypothetical protein